MATDQETGTASIRANFYDKTVKGFATATYKFKQAVSIVSTSAWNNFFFRENSTALSAQPGNNIKGISRGAAFPQAVVNWDRIQANILKFGLEDTIHWEDILANDIDVRDRTLFRIAEGVAKAVDDYIWDILTESQSPSAIQSVTIAAGYAWNEASAAIFDNFGSARRLIATKNYPISDLIAFVSPRGYQDILTYLYGKGSQAPTVGSDVALNGEVTNVNGIRIVVSNSVTASYALVVVPQRCATYRELVPLSTTTTEDPYKSVRVRSVEEGVLQLTDPNCCVLLKNTQLAGS